MGPCVNCSDLSFSLYVILIGKPNRNDTRLIELCTRMRGSLLVAHDCEKTMILLPGRRKSGTSREQTAMPWFL